MVCRPISCAVGRASTRFIPEGVALRLVTRVSLALRKLLLVSELLTPYVSCTFAV